MRGSGISEEREAGSDADNAISKILRPKSVQKPRHCGPGAGALSMWGPVFENDAQQIRASVEKFIQRRASEKQDRQVTAIALLGLAAIALVAK